MNHQHHHQHSHHGSAHHGDDHDHSTHDHRPGRQHHHADPEKNGRAFFIAVALNSVFVVIEFAYGFIANSTALMADAGHNLSDVLGLLLAWGAIILARKKPSQRYTYGMSGASILAALANAVLLLLACGAIALEAISRFTAPPVVSSLTVCVVAGIGIFINGISAWLFMRGSKNDLNVRAAYLHMVADAAISLGVVLAGFAMYVTGWYWLDPAISLAIVIAIIVSTWGLLRESMELSLNAVPANVDAPAIETYLQQLAGVTAVHDLHIWGLSTSQNALTAHLVMPAGHPGDAFIDDVMQALEERFLIHHSTLQIEQGNRESACALQH